MPKKIFTAATLEAGRCNCGDPGCEQVRIYLCDGHGEKRAVAVITLDQLQNIVATVAETDAVVKH